MALEFICSNEIESRKKINIPKGANCYRLKSRRIKFFHAEIMNGEARILKNSGFISFDIEGNRFTIEYGHPTFYDGAGNNLKSEEYSFG